MIKVSFISDWVKLFPLNPSTRTKSAVTQLTYISLAKYLTLRLCSKEPSWRSLSEAMSWTPVRLDWCMMLYLSVVRSLLFTFTSCIEYHISLKSLDFERQQVSSWKFQVFFSYNFHKKSYRPEWSSADATIVSIDLKDLSTIS